MDWSEAKVSISYLVCRSIVPGVSVSNVFVLIVVYVTCTQCKGNTRQENKTTKFFSRIQHFWKLVFKRRLTKRSVKETLFYYFCWRLQFCCPVLVMETLRPNDRTSLFIYMKITSQVFQTHEQNKLHSSFLKQSFTCLSKVYSILFSLKNTHRRFINPSLM